jgi:hypothetical protein
MQTSRPRPIRQAGVACKRRLREQLTTAASKRQQRPRVLNDDDPITLEPVDPWAKTTFLSVADKAGQTVYAHDAPGLLRYCVESPGLPHDPVTRREFTAAECGGIEAAAGRPGEISCGRQRAAVAREADRSAEAIDSDDNQAALVGVLTQAIREATADACACPLDELMQVATFLSLELRPTAGAIIGALNITAAMLTTVQDELEQSFSAAAAVSDTRPHAAALVMLMADTVMDVVRDRMRAAGLPVDVSLSPSSPSSPSNATSSSADV